MGGSGAWHPGRLQPHAPSKEVGGAAPLCIAPCVCIKASSGRPIGHPGNVVPKGHPPFSGRVFRACAQPGTGPVLRPLRHASQHIMPESGRTPGPPTVPGSFFGHCGIFFWVFPSFGNSFHHPPPKAAEHASSTPLLVHVRRMPARGGA